MVRYTFIKSYQSMGDIKPLDVLDRIQAKDMNDVRKKLMPVSRIEKVVIQINKGEWAYSNNWMGNIYPNGTFMAPSGKKYMINADGILRLMVAKKPKKRSKAQKKPAPFGL